ncbi:MAG TPA: hypothetical protein VFP72_22885, partial [Kineosporiaceae bacterium]|nr:hypothetical protein [Kineosporiaceae bacterium]
MSINAGGPANGAYRADAYYAGGETYETTNEIDTSLLGDGAPPASVFQTERYGDFTYTVANRTAGSAQSVTLYFEE